MARPIAGEEPLDQRVPLLLSETTKRKIDNTAARESGGNASRWVRTVVETALSPLMLWGAACCGPGLTAESGEPLARLRSIRDLLPGNGSSSARHYALRAEGNSMNHPTEPRLDIQDDDILVFEAERVVSNGQIVHYEVEDEFGLRTCGIRTFYQSPDGTVTLRASNDSIDPRSQQRVYPDMVMHGEEVRVIGVWTRVTIRGAQI